MKREKLRVMASALALATILNSCSVTIKKKNSSSTTPSLVTTSLTEDLTNEKAFAILSGNNTVSFYFSPELTSTFTKIEDGLYSLEQGYLPYQIINNETSKIATTTENNQTLISTSNDLEGYIGVKEEYIPLLDLNKLLNDEVLAKNPSLTTELKPYSLEKNTYLIPTGYELYCLDNNLAYPLIETEEGIVYSIPKESLSNYIAVNTLVAKALSNGNLLMTELTNRYYDSKNLVK